jgi:hypothetical protein
MIPTLLAGVVAASGGCDLLMDETDHTFNGPPTVEFAPVLPSATYALTVTFPDGATTSQTVNVRVNYISAPPSANVTGEFAAVGTTTAVEGTHYRLPNGNSYVIAAGANSVDIPIELLGAGLADGANVTLVLELMPGSGFEVSENYKRFTVTSRKTGS